MGTQARLPADRSAAAYLSALVSEINNNYDIEIIQ
jgi:hypothetical protein